MIATVPHVINPLAATKVDAGLGESADLDAKTIDSSTDYHPRVMVGKGMTLPLKFRDQRGGRSQAHTLPDKLTRDLRVRKATLPAEGKGRWDGVRQRDKEGAR